MGKNKGRRDETNGDWEASGTEDSLVNGSSGNSTRNRAVASEAGEFRDGNDNDHVNDNAGGGRHRQNRGGSSSQPRRKNSLGPWTNGVSETVQSMEAAHQKIKELQEKFMSHLDDLENMEETKNKLMQLEEQCSKQENAINILANMKRKSEQSIEQERQEIEIERTELEQEKEKLDKRVATSIAEEKLKFKSELDELLLKHGQSHEKRRTELEEEFTKKKEENDRRVAALEAANQQLSATVKQLKEKIVSQTKELEDSVEQCDLLKRAIDSFKKEKADRETELDMMKKEFSLSLRSKEYFEQRFADICVMIHNISWTYFGGIEREDLEKVHQELAKADPCFASLPIDDTDDSRNLRVAHAQRIISEAICECIWKPFQSEFTLSHSGLNDSLDKIAGEVGKLSQSGFAANAWMALTMKALQSLQTGPIKSQAAGSREPIHPTGSSRAERVVSKVFSLLTPLVSTSQYEELKNKLLNLANQAIEIWNDAHTGGLKVIVSTLLEPARREEWRSQEFDPELPSGDYDEARSDTTYKTHPRTFTLFPRVVAREAASVTTHDSSLPGSWPQDSDQGPRTIETCIHPGIGLPESSPLVVRGKTLQEEHDDFLSKAHEKALKEFQSTRRLTGQGRRDSMASSISSPSSPSQQWKAASTMKAPEK